VFALGVVLYELTTGRRCFSGTSDFERMLAVVRGEFVSPTAIVPGFPPGLARVIKTALAVDKNKRYASAAALLEALEGLAAAEDWQLHSAPIVTLMTELYGEAPDPFVELHTVEITDSAIVADHDPDSEVAIMVEPPIAEAVVQPTVIITRPRRLARGTESDVSDDQPTRGRRSLPAIFAPRVAA